MNKLLQKRSRLAQVQARISELRAIETRSEAEESELSNLFTEGEALVVDINALQEEEARAARLAEFAGRSANPLPTPAPAPGNPAEEGAIVAERLRVPAQARRSQPGAVFRDDRIAYAFGQFVLATGAGSRAARAQQWLAANGIQMRATGIQEGNDQYGGYLVAPEFSTDIIRLVAEYGVFRRFSRIVSMGSSEYNQPKRLAGLTAVPVSELATIAASAPTKTKIGLNARKWGILVPTSSEFTEDTMVDFANDLALDFALAFAQAEDDAGFKGDGTSTYNRILGVIPALLSVASNAGIVAATGNLLSEVASGDLITMKSRLPSYTRRMDPTGIRWFCSQEFESAVFERIALAAGGATAERWLSGAERSFLGFPIEITESLTTEQGNSEVPCVLGSLRLATLFGDRRAVDIQMSEHSAFREDALEWRATERFDINVHELGTSSAAGPLVGLQLAAS